MKLKTKTHFRLQAVAARQGRFSVASRDGLRHNDHVLVSGGTRIRDGKIENRYEVSSRRKLVHYVYSQVSRGVLRPRASDRQRIFNRLHERYL